MAENLEQNVDQYYSSSQTDKAYEKCWGEGNIHFGYFPHLLDKEKKPLNFEDGATELTKRMIEVGQITSQSRVIDFGCGYGRPAIEIALFSGAEVIGIDLSEMHIQKSKENLAKTNERRKEKGEKALNVRFFVGSFTEISDEIRALGKFTHVFSQVAICHVHCRLDTIFAEAKSVLAKDGKAILCDFIGSKEETKETTKEHVWKRLKFTELKNHQIWTESLVKTGFVVEEYENLDQMLSYSYRLLTEIAEREGFLSEDGVPLHINYKFSAEAAASDQIGMNLVRARLA
mmetsp:Transcript_10043/g.13538  ORF Transcript_10043/g.13538 Transcript_10043/m.13538 type:complete len:288 (+) Transcript_10043:171-1034(+)|eukprot:CAMPEP_0201489174 /NCGR_PEP_ID=MMETSP0151_2-20130828/21068_1 /ASSEMBLY_ACC=CAM_ASM_000257 /TAXON_ID=200890 /ORGANISM="Paramoeba atlantica, Strain 621/1 / CCAP 1560/9" /LENGTH=287 /DNA_ID=CAMNT_0047874669 /DNA_START=142 /DNA_END=1005 /DNA_ORIENTATION=+